MKNPLKLSYKNSEKSIITPAHPKLRETASLIYNSDLGRIETKVFYYQIVPSRIIDRIERSTLLLSSIR